MKTENKIYPILVTHGKYNFIPQWKTFEKRGIQAEAYLDCYQTSMMELFRLKDFHYWHKNHSS